MSDRDSRRDITPVQAAERFIRKRENKNTANTVRSYRQRTEAFVMWAHEQGIESMRELDGWLIDEYERHLEEQGNAPATVKGKLSALKELLKYCADIEVVDEDLPDKVTLPRLSKDDQTNDDLLAADDARGLLNFYRDSVKHTGTVQHAVLEVLWHVGCRTSCLRSLDVGDWDPEERVLRFRHRPPETRLKDGKEHERNVAVPKPVADALELFVARERPEKRDDAGRKPLFSTTHGRASETSIQCWAYQATQPCIYAGCPHNRRRDTCEYTHRQHSSKCPSSRSPHAIRTGSITWQLNQGLSYVKVAKRVAASPETIRRYYDKPDLEEELARRRPETENLDIMNDLTTEDDADE
ncbi:tyrosine-type recombinase/integrase [Halarchaeum sp. P4]|uniref:tyrosine-type recombinase/integrase n=1 Tax=Halarchaeum sp. P4 TaxID=3421639 RepID=UPI003EBDE310